jgi:hypothetical protein
MLREETGTTGSTILSAQSLMSKHLKQPKSGI